MSRPGLLVIRRLVGVEPRPLPHGVPARPTNSTLTPAAASEHFAAVRTGGMVGTRILTDDREAEQLPRWRRGRVRRRGTPSNEGWRVAA